MAKGSQTFCSKEEDLLCVRLPSRLDARNAPDVSAEIEACLAEDILCVRIDAENLRYISADGLDVILELKKKCRDLSIEHARMGVCDILEEYGFDSFVHISRQYRFVSVKGCEIIGRGSHGTIYRTGADTIVKVYRDNSTPETIENERRYARNAFIKGIPTAIVYDVVQTEYGYGVMFEMLGGMTLGGYLSKHPDDVERYAVQFADLLRRLNTTTAEKELYRDFHDVYLERTENAKRFIPDEDAETLKRVILSIPRGGEMIHGDYHPNNVMVGPSGELLLIDMADISRGNGFFDIAGSSLVMDYLARIPLLRQITKKVTSLDPKTCLKMWEIVIRRYYASDDPELLAMYAKQFRAFSKLRIAMAVGIKSSRAPLVTKLLAIYTRKFFVPKAKEYIRIFTESSAGRAAP